MPRWNAIARGISQFVGSHEIERILKLKTSVLWFVLLTVETVGAAEEMPPPAIFKKVIAAYQSMETYSAEGTIISDIDSGSGKMRIETSFSIKMKKPNQYLIIWDQRTESTHRQSGAVWDGGSQPYLYMGAMNAYSKMNSDEMALAAATGISGGATFTIPSLFLPVFKKQPEPFARLVDPKLTGSEQIEGEDCYVITASSTVSKAETFWISKRAYVIRKYSRSFEAPDGEMKPPKMQMTDQQLDEAIRGMGQEVTEGRREAMRKIMRHAEDTRKTGNLKGVSTELHTKIAAPKLKAEDFAFTPPDGAVIKESLFGGVLNAK